MKNKNLIFSILWGVLFIMLFIIILIPKNENTQSILSLLTFILIFIVPFVLIGCQTFLVIKIEDDLYYYSDSAIICRTNYGTIENGYIYGKDIITEFTNGTNPSRNIGTVARYGGVKSTINRVYSLSSIRFMNNQSNDKGGIFGWETYGKVENSYVVGDTNPLKPDNGPVIAHIQATGRFNNVFYISENIYTYLDNTSPKGTDLQLVYAQFDTGANVNVKLKTLAGQSNPTVTTPTVLASM